MSLAIVALSCVTLLALAIDVRRYLGEEQDR